MVGSLLSGSLAYLGQKVSKFKSHGKKRNRDICRDTKLCHSLRSFQHEADYRIRHNFIFETKKIQPASYITNNTSVY